MKSSNNRSLVPQVHKRNERNKHQDPFQGCHKRTRTIQQTKQATTNCFAVTDWNVKEGETKTNASTKAITTTAEERSQRSLIKKANRKLRASQHNGRRSATFMNECISKKISRSDTMFHMFSWLPKPFQCTPSAVRVADTRLRTH